MHLSHLLFLGLNAARCAPSRSGEHIDIRLPHGLSDDDDDDDDDEDEDEEEEERGNGVVGVNANAGVAAHRSQLLPLPADATRDELANVSLFMAPECHTCY